MPDEKQPPSPAVPGDVLPNLILPDATGTGVGLAQQTRAGHWQVLFFLEPGMLADQAEAISKARARLDKCEGRFYAVLFSAPDTTVAGADLFDESKRGAAFLLGEEAPGVAVLSPEGRLAARFGPDSLGEAAAYCEKAFKAAPAEVIASHAPVLIIPDVFEPDLCDRVIAFWKEAPKRENEVASARRGNEAAYEEVKIRTDALIPDGELFADIRARITRRVLPLVDRAFRMQIASMEPLRVGCYAASSEGKFGPHRDNTTRFTAHRRFAMSLNLNTGDYEGGEIRFPEYGRQLYSPAKGGAVIFSCSLLHEALPVTKGERFGVFTFFTDAAGLEQEKRAAREREMMAQQAGQPAPQS